MGKESALNGRPKESCPFKGGPVRKAWLAAHRANTTFVRPEPTPTTASVDSAKLDELVKVTERLEAGLANLAKAVGTIGTKDVVRERPKSNAPFRPDSKAAVVLSRLRTGRAYDLVALFQGVQSEAPLAIINDIRRKGINVVRMRTQYAIREVE